MPCQWYSWLRRSAQLPSLPSYAGLTFGLPILANGNPEVHARPAAEQRPCEEMYPRSAAHWIS